MSQVLYIVFFSPQMATFQAESQLTEGFKGTFIVLSLLPWISKLQSRPCPFWLDFVGFPQPTLGASPVLNFTYCSYLFFCQGEVEHPEASSWMKFQEKKLFENEPQSVCGKGSKTWIRIPGLWLLLRKLRTTWGNLWTDGEDSMSSFLFCFTKLGVEPRVPWV